MTTQPKWTPGEWELAGNTIYADNIRVAVACWDEYILSMETLAFAKEELPDWETAQANAKLIAASKNLAEALMEVLRILEAADASDGTTTNMIRAALKTAGIDREAN